MICNTFWNYCFCFVLLRQKKAAKILIFVEFLVKNVSRFNVYRKAVICHDIVSMVQAKERNKYITVFIK